MGKTGIESRLIGTVTSCKLCKPSDYWLGKFSTKPQINNGKLWTSQHLDSIGLSDSDKANLLTAIENIKIKIIPSCNIVVQGKIRDSHLAFSFFRIIPKHISIPLYFLAYVPMVIRYPDVSKDFSKLLRTLATSFEREFDYWDDLVMEVYKNVDNPHIGLETYFKTLHWVYLNKPYPTCPTVASRS